MTDLQTFRQDTRAWLAANCPASMRSPMVPGEEVGGGNKRRSSNPDAYIWLQRMAAKGWTVPTWPAAYGGAGLDKTQFLILLEELQAIQARPPLGGMGVTMLGPTLLEYGTDDQKLRHLPPIARGETAWCQGYSEPGAGSDLASLQTKAEDKGDYYLVNGSKIWTSGADYADWIFCLVRTDKQAPKHEGISFLLFSMDSPGVTTLPIVLLNGQSPFCQTFFDNVQVPKSQLVHKVNQGWSVAKRLLQHERSGLAALASADTAGPLDRIKPELSLPNLARHYGQSNVIEDSALRTSIIGNEMLKRAYLLTQQRTVAESEANTPGAATSIFKYVEAELVKAQLEIQLRIRGTQGLGWEGDNFSAREISMGRLWLESKAISIAGGSNEIQLNIIAKRVLGLPD
ncbi:MAG: acyl-CoA dehydrogenase family protein [Pseudomonadales bacterium]|jgi:alkylation response protein AidB-like acyl-CoA dehydrogenase|nr:acyl-CoA dehydrogenase family protein [Pseudomonadales bacterium]MDP4639335.1 acyl-CoA dehydrogenase family protein [Pseudomonadales bacterium]MDP4765963.1 acyl-CoA dehydrogenase family protein [Pseudomonadales bacterium]MDP4874982.1 acyl-CoA dehydrogenase family protein [Pseudomonadales bacterium]MDP4912479.1 acyl-CoA dehydrogenase family protein [Pseudomonadales bacterium]